MLLSSREMQALEAKAFADGVTAEALMDEAGAKIAAAISQFFPEPGRCVVHFGKGHNGGDALVAARHLAHNGWQIELKPAFGDADWSELTARKRRELDNAPTGSGIALSSQNMRGPRPLIVLDGLLGIGGHGPLREPIASATREIRRCHDEAGAAVFAVDLPTGLNADNGEASPDAVVADFTLTIGFPKRGLVADAATPFVGRLAVLPLDELTARATHDAAGDQLITATTLAPLLPRRAFDVHKGDFGRIGIVAGSRGLTGAAIMAAEACVCAGAGLVSLYVTEDIHPIVASSTRPEVMVRPIASYLDVLDQPRDVFAVGPGLGQSRKDEALALIERCEKPMVLDADGLNIVATDLSVLARCAGQRLLTPHPGEMARLLETDGKNLQGSSRREVARAFVERWPVTLLFKGSRTIVAEASRPLAFNTTGSPGMATGGMGDVLTGVCAAMLGHGLSTYDAARAGTWLCGRAAELAITFGGESEESLSAGRLRDHLGAAFKELRARSY